MPSDFIIKTGDMIQITMTPPCIVPPIAAPVPLVGSEKTVLVGNMPICVFGDELPKAISSPLPYTSAPFGITGPPGMGTLKIILAPNNLTKQTVAGNKPIIVKGVTFQAIFTVTVPAQNITPAGVTVPDPVPTKPGTCQFITTNVNTFAG